MLSRDYLPARIGSVATSPLVLLVGLLAVLAILLSLPLTVPIGPMYWDTYLYIDAAHRIWDGQIPNVDFETPVGPLGYYLFTWGFAAFPRAQPLLLAQWSTLAVAAPLMAIVLAELSKTSRNLAYALLLPFIIFAVAPVNAQIYHSIPSVDGFGIYNRQGVLLLYVLAAGLVFLPDGRKLAFFCAATMLTLLLTKVTGFLVGGLLCLGALAAGRISVTNAIISVAVFALPLVILEATTAIVSSYLKDIIELASMNSSSLLPRFRTVVINKLDVLLPAALLFLALFWIDCRRRDPDIGLFDHSSVWLALAILGGVIFETQNTGSQEFIFVWPVLLMILLRTKSFAPNHRIAVGILAAFFVIPTLTVILSKTARAIAVAPIYTPANAALLSNVGQVSARDDIMRRAQMLDEHYARFTAAYQDLADQDQLPSWQYYSELDNQMQWILSANRMIAAFHNFEKERGIRIESLMTLDFADPFPWILNRKTTPHIQIGGDPTRTVPAMTPDTMAAVEATQGVLKPKCPVTWGRDKIERIYDAALKDREIVHLDPCWDLLVRRDLVPSHE